MTKNVRVIDESGRLIGTTYPKRAKGLVKSGRARYVSCESEDTICLTCPPDILEDKTMTDNSLDLAFTNTAITDTGNNSVAEQTPAPQTPAHAAIGAYTPSAEHALRMLERITTDTDFIKQAVTKVSANTDNGVAHIVEAREKTNRDLVTFYTNMYNEFRPSVKVKKNSVATHFTEMADMLRELKRSDYDDIAWQALMEAAKMQLTRSW